MDYPRSSGILLHPTSLPGRYGIGDLGEWAYRFVDFLQESGQTLWQVLPLGPTSYGDSPYQALSTFAGNPLLISLDKLMGEGWLTQAELNDAPAFSNTRVEYGEVIDYHDSMLHLAFERFQKQASPGMKSGFRAWCDEQAYWLEDYALFNALKRHFDKRPWTEWDEGFALRDPDALAGAQKDHDSAIVEQKFRQWLFFWHWMDLKNYAIERNVRLVGDIPIFVAHDSSDVWANRHLFFLDDAGNPTLVAGVPPDYFAPEHGQYWGNPLYNWETLKEQQYEWWIRRVGATLKLVDILRVDHFRGFEAYWEVPRNDEQSAKGGRWVPGPGRDFFTTLRAALGDLPIIAEDLGVITPEVVELREEFGLPGMKVLQFAWGGRGGENSFLPHNHVPNSFVYTGTHDNNTTVGWWYDPEEVDDNIRDHLQRYVDRQINEPNWTLIRLGMASVAHNFVMPMQDLLGLGADARMNTPGQGEGNWSWRVTVEELQFAPRDRLRELTELYARLPE